MRQHAPLKLPLYTPEPPEPRASEFVSFGLEYLFLCCVTLLFFQGMSVTRNTLLNDISINFLAIMLEALPFMLIGSLASGLIEVFVHITWIDRIFQQRKITTVFLAGAMGLFFPVCECAIIPVIRRLLSKGIPLSAAITFLLAGPIVNGIVAASTAIAYRYNWTVVGVRMGLGYALAVFIGLLMGRFFNRENSLLPTGRSRTSCACGHNHDDVKLSLFSRLRHALEHASDDFFDVGRYLIIGSFITAVMRSALNMSTFLHLMDSPWLAILLMMAMAITLNLCSETDAFIAASFKGLLPDSSQMAFMVLGPMLDIKLILMYFSVFRKRAILFLILTVFTTVFLTMLGLQKFFPHLSQG